MNAEDQQAESPNHTKSRSGPVLLSLSRCAACYNQKKSWASRHGGDGESSSSAEDSGPEVDSDSEAESSSSFNSSEEAFSVNLEEPETENHFSLSGDVPGHEVGGKGGDGGEEAGQEAGEEAGETTESLEDKGRPDTIVSTLHLQVLPQKHSSEAFHIVKACKETTEESAGGGGDGNEHLLPPQMGSQWQQWSQPALQQHQLSYHYQQQAHQVLHQQQQPQHFAPLSAQSQRFPSALPSSSSVIHPPGLPTALQAPNASQTQLDALNPQHCWYCYSMHSPYSSYWSHCRGAHTPR